MASLAVDNHRPRRQPRVAYSAPVRVSGDWSDREPCFVPLLAQSLDLSEGGMAVVVPLPLHIGSIVTCSMRVGGCQLYVVGNVVWERLADDGMRRAGIEFLPPNHEDTGLMRRLLDLGKLHPHRIHVRFEGRPDTLTALAQVTRTGLALTAPLPILQRDTNVRFAFAHEGADGTSFHGRIERVRLAQLEGMPALQVGIRVNDASALHSATPSVERASPADRSRDDVTPTSVEVIPAPAEPEPIGLAASTYAFARAMTARAASLRLPTSLAVVLSVGALGLGALTHELSRDVPSERSQPLIAPATAHASQAPQRAPTMQLELEPTPPVMIEALPLVAPEPPRELTFKWRRMRREIFVPIAGDIRAVDHFRVGQPLGITVDLPFVAPPDKNERHSVRKPGVQRVDVARYGRGTRIHVWASRPFTDYNVEIVRGGLRITFPGPFTP